MEAANIVGFTDMAVSPKGTDRLLRPLTQAHVPCHKINFSKINGFECWPVIGAKVRAAEVLLSAAVGEAWGNGSGEDRKVGAFHIERFQVLKRHVAARKSRRSVASRAEGAGHPLDGRHHRAAAGDRRSA